MRGRGGGHGRPRSSIWGLHWGGMNPWINGDLHPVAVSGGGACQYAGAQRLVVRRVWGGWVRLTLEAGEYEDLGLAVGRDDAAHGLDQHLDLALKDPVPTSVCKCGM